jgi:hypothetical protein
LRALTFARERVGVRASPPEIARRLAARREFLDAPGGELTPERQHFRARRRAIAVFRGFSLARPLNCHANVNVIYHCAAAAALLAVTAASPPARAGDAPGFGISLDGYAAPTWDHTVTNQQTGDPARVSRGALGLATLLNVDEFALGGVVDGVPGIFGEGRLTVGGMVGWQPRLGSYRYQLLGELGQERFSDVGAMLVVARPMVGETWLPYVGARLGMTETFSREGHFVLGAWVFVRRDLAEANVSSAQSDYVVGGYAAGVAFRVGMRFEQAHVSSETDPLPAAPGEGT